METYVLLTLLFEKYVQLCLESRRITEVYSFIQGNLYPFSVTLCWVSANFYTAGLFGIKNAHFLIVSFKDVLKLFPSKQQFRKFKSLFPF